MFAIYKKELRSYFLNAIGYVYVGVFLAVSALLCCFTTLSAKTYDTTDYFTYIIFSFIVLIPLLTMKLFSEEKKLRTEQLLLTAPVSLWGMVLGKFLAAFTLFLGTVLVSCINFFPLYVYANAEGLGDAYASAVGPVGVSIICCTVGIVLIGAAFIAIGLFISTLTENQLAAAVITVTVIVVMLLLNVVNSFIDVYAVRFVIDWVCIISRFSNFTAGILDFSAIVYYLSLTAVFLLLANRVYEKRRWG
jgi:ABC-2 type transport system permease protein